MKRFFISEYVPEMTLKLINEIAAQIQIGKPFNSANQSIIFKEPKFWVMNRKYPVSQIDFCVNKGEKNIVHIIMWGAYKPDENNFMTHRRLDENFNWDYLYTVAKLKLEEKNGKLPF